MINDFIIHTAFVLITGVNIGMLLCAIIIWSDKRTLRIKGVLHKKHGTFVTTDNDGGYKYTPKPKGVKK